MPAPSRQDKAIDCIGNGVRDVALIALGRDMYISVNFPSESDMDGWDWK